MFCVFLLSTDVREARADCPRVMVERRCRWELWQHLFYVESRESTIRLCVGNQ